jgi:NADH:ubiquinone oxidoreductase subunit 6 (subunit J)
MKLKITPLNIATAFLLVAAAYIGIYGICAVFVLFALVVFVIDMMLRNFFPETKKLWIIELCFIVLTAVIYLLVK